MSRVRALDHGAGHVQASALVGRGAEIIDSSIWVATIDRPGALPGQADRAFLDRGNLLERKLDAQVAAGHHDPVERVDDIRQHADRLGFSILAISGTCRPTWLMILRARAASSGERTNESATTSTPKPSAQRRSASSLSVSAGALDRPRRAG